MARGMNLSPTFCRFDKTKGYERSGNDNSAHTHVHEYAMAERESRGRVRSGSDLVGARARSHCAGSHGRHFQCVDANRLRSYKRRNDAAHLNEPGLRRRPWLLIKRKWQETPNASCW